MDITTIGSGVAVGKEADKYGGIVLTGEKNEPNITILVRDKNLNSFIELFVVCQKATNKR